MAIDTALSPRQHLLLTLSTDLAAQGWGQRQKVWHVVGDGVDEWLEYAGEITGAPPEYLKQVIVDEQFPVEAHGLLLASEGWEYPRELAESFKTEASRRAYWQVSPPSSHPHRVDVRQLLLVCNDGDVLALKITNEAKPVITWAAIDLTSPSPVGDETVDVARAMLGVNEPLRKTIWQQEGVRALSRIMDALGRALDGSLSEEEVAREVFLIMPERQRREMIRDFPDDIRELLRRSLTVDERARYGL